MADALDLGSSVLRACRFESCSSHPVKTMLCIVPGASLGRRRGKMKRHHLWIPLALLWAGFALPTAVEPAASMGPTSFVAPADEALVVFVRPSKRGKAISFYVVDESKKLLTLVKSNEHVAITLSPGKHSLYVVAENAGLVRAELAAGRTYIISTRPKMGLGRARVVVEPALRTSPNFAESAKWLRDTKQGNPDFDKGARWVRNHRDALDKRISVAEWEWSSGNASARAALTMGVDDGRTQKEAGAL